MFALIGLLQALCALCVLILIPSIFVVFDKDREKGSWEIRGLLILAVLAIIFWSLADAMSHQN